MKGRYQISENTLGKLQYPSDFNATKSIQALRSIKSGIWIYFFLLLFEGCLRKWILPSLSNPLLLIRDPIAFWIIISAIRNKVYVFNNNVKGMWILGFFCILSTLLFGHRNLLVSLYGARIYILHFPLIFIIGSVFKKSDVLKIGRVMLFISIPMTVLIALQFYSPQSAWVNRGIGGDEAGAGFSGSMGFFRPPGTFSFTNGNTLFYSLLAPFVFYFWLKPKSVNKFFLFASTISLLAAIPISISRSLYFQVIITLFFSLISIGRKPEYFKKMVIAGVVIAIAFLLISKTDFFQTSTEAFSARLNGANESEGGIEGVVGSRYFGTMVGAFTNSLQIPFFGYGLGCGSAVGVRLLQGYYPFNAEDEWTRIIGEVGLILGIVTIAIRLKLSFIIAKASWKALSCDNLLPWILLSFALLNIPQGQWAQPTTLGFSILIGGFVLASLNAEK